MDALKGLLAVFTSFTRADWIATAAALAAGVAAWQAVRANQVARRMYNIAVKEQQRADATIDLYLVDSHIRHLPAEGRRIYVFELLITNRSVAANSVKQLSPALEYGRQHQGRVGGAAQRR